MNRCSAGTRRLIFAAALIGISTTLPPRLLSAQEVAGEVKSRWEVGAVSEEWCVHFLVEPTEAQDGLARGYRTLAAREVSDLPAPLLRVLADEPQYADWVPSQLCVAFPEEVTAEKRVYSRGDGGKPLALLWWGVAAAGDGSDPTARGLFLRLFATTTSGLKRQMELDRIPMDRITVERGPVKDSDDQRVRMRLDNAEIVFDGHPRQDSTLTPQPVHQLAALAGNLRHVWIVTTNLQATSAASLSGALRIQGKGDIARILNRSPIRLLGARISGAGGEVLFHEQQ